MASPTHSDSASETSAKGKKLTTIDLVGGIYCHICQSTFQNKKDYDSHYVEHKATDTGIVYTCVVCNQRFNGYPSFRGHCYTKHVIKSKFKCDHCNKLFSKLIALKEHIENQHKFKCSLCNKDFNSKKEWQIHQIVHNTDNPPYNCQSCKKQINSVDGCEDHINLHSSNIYACPICKKDSNSKQQAVIHLKQHFGDETIDETNLDVEEIPSDDVIENLGGILCCICFTVHRNRLNFDAHFSIKHGELDIVYTCNKCEKQFEKYSAFTNHCYYHFMKNRFQCDQCFKMFARPSLLAIHMEAYHGTGECTEKPFVCMCCEHRFATQRAMRTHLRDQHDITCVLCPQDGCEGIFETPKELTLHLRVHNNTEKWCRLCGLLFTTLSSCEKHLDAHRKTIYTCPICNKNYGEKYMVIRHVSKHFETVVHICKVCGKIYNAKNRLVEHSKSHSDVSVHICTHCGKRFPQLKQLRQHMSTHSDVKPYKCDVCPKSFASYPNWKKHLQRMHNIKGKLIKKVVCDVPIEPNSENSTDASGSKESPPDSKSSEASDTNADTFKLVQSDDSTMESDTIDPIVIEDEDLQILEVATDMCTDVLAESTNLFIPESVEESLATETSTANYPLEYGPEFNSGLEADGFGFIDLEERVLPHIDPRLTIRMTGREQPVYVQTHQELDNDTNTNFDAEKWEPIITKVYQDYSYGCDTNMLSVINTDIFETVFT